MLRTFLTTALSAFALAPLALAQGDLDPPAGAPAPNMKTLQEIWDKVEHVETRTPITSVPITITEPGSYYLAGDLEHDGSGTAILIRSGAVTLDLGGHTLSSTAATTGNAIYVLGNFTDKTWLPVKIRNGFITGTTEITNIGSTWDTAPGGFSTGVNASQLRVIVSDLVVEGCRITGISTGQDGEAHNCTSVRNGVHGFSSNGGGVFENCSSRENAFRGFNASSSLVRGCVAISNKEDGFHSTARPVVSNCISFSNGEDGFDLSAGCSLSFCTASQNGGSDMNVNASTNRTGNFPTP